MKRIIVGISGASGALLGERFIRHLLDAGCTVHAVVSPSGARVFEEELDIRLGRTHAELAARLRRHYGNPRRLSVAPADDFAARISSGSAPVDAMVIVPCSLSTAAAIAHGITLNLIHRAASVTIKEKRPLVVVPRESPLSVIHLKNLLALAEAGVHVLPATTAFYHRPKTVESMVDFTLSRVLDHLGIRHELIRRWRDEGE